MPTFETDAATSSTLKVTIVSPSNKTYNSGLLTLNVTVYWLFACINHMLYSIDGQESCEFSGKRPQTEPFSPIHGTVIGEAALPELSEGPHEITVYIIGTVNFPFDIQTKSTTYFTIDSTPPDVTVLTIQNETYTQPSLPLDFSIDESTSWIGYCLDDEANMTLTDNVTLTAEGGPHSLLLYANDTAGNMGKSDMINFTIQTNQSTPQLMIVTSAVSIVIIVVISLVYLKNRKKGN
jgi:hypothetical protein